MVRFARVKDFDWTMFFVVMIICALGVLQIFSATHDTVWQGSWWKQIIYIAAGLALAWAATNLDYHSLMGQVYAMYLAAVVLLVAVLIVGKSAFGSTRWISLPAGIHLQVSEFAKIAIILLVARFLTELKTDVLEWRDLLKLSGVILLPMALIAKEPDLGTALTYIPILLIGIFLAGMRWKYWLAIGIVLLVAVPIAYSTLHAYQKARIVSFLDSVEDRGRRGGDVGERCDEGEPDAVALPAGAPHGLYFFGLRRGTRVHRRDAGDGFVLCFAHADRSKCPNGAGPCWNVRLHGCRIALVISYTGKRRDGGGPDAGHWNPAAFDELWRIEHLVYFPDAGSCEQCSRTQVCELTSLLKQKDLAVADVRRCFRSPLLSNELSNKYQNFKIVVGNQV